MSAIFTFEIKGVKENKIFNYFKGLFSVMRGPMDIIFDVFSESYVILLISIASQFFSKYSQKL